LFPHIKGENYRLKGKRKADLLQAAEPEKAGEQVTESFQTAT